MKKIIFSILSLLVCIQSNATDFQWAFPADTISTSGVNASDPQVAIDSNGNTFSVWVENGFVKAKVKLVGMSWGTISTISSSGASTPRIVSDLNGNATAIWIEGGVLKTAAKPFSGSWSASSSLSTAGASAPSLAVNSAGDVVAVWVRSGNIESCLKLFGANWQTRVTITSSGASSPSVAMGGTGTSKRAVVVWHGVASSINVVYSATRLLSASWSTALALSDTTTHAAFARVALDASANATAIWYQYNFTDPNYSGVVVQSSSRPASGSWTTPVNLSTPGIRNPANLSAQIGYDGSGNAIAVWNTSYNDETINIQSAVKPLRGNWTSATNMVQDNLFSYSSDLSVSTFGDALAVYLFYNGVDLLIQSSESDITGFMNQLWSIPLTLSQGTNNCCPRVATAANGNEIRAAAVWLSSNGLNTSLLAATATKTLVLPPSGLSVSQTSTSYGVFTQYRNTLSWTASSDPNVTGYLVYRNGVLIGEVAPNVLQYVDDNRVQNGSVVYGVASLDDQNAHSQIVTVTFP